MVIDHFKISYFVLMSCVCVCVCVCVKNLKQHGGCMKNSIFFFPLDGDN
jgi:hypothetical protein